MGVVKSRDLDIRDKHFLYKEIMVLIFFICMIVKYSYYVNYDIEDFVMSNLPIRTTFTIFKYFYLKYIWILIINLW